MSHCACFLLGIHVYFKLSLEASFECQLVNFSEVLHSGVELACTDLCVSTCHLLQNGIMDEHVLLLKYHTCVVNILQALVMNTLTDS